jgi:O-antigen ligase
VEKSITNKWMYWASFLYILINAILISGNLYYIAYLIPIALIIAYLAFFKLDVIIFIILFFVPLSVPLRAFSSGTPIDVILPTEPLIAGVMLLFYLKVLIEGGLDSKILKHPVTIFIIINLLWMFFTTIFSKMFYVSIKSSLSRLWFETTFYFAIILLFKKYSNIFKYVWIYAVPLIAVIVYFTFRLIKGGINQVNANGACQPFYDDHTSYGAALAIMFISIIGIIIIDKNAGLFKRFFYYIMLIIYTFALIMSYTRAAWLSVLFSLMILILMWFKIKFKTVILLIGLVITLFLTYQTQIYIYLERNKQDSDKSLIKHFTSSSNIRNDYSNKERINRWMSAIRMFKNHPIMGYGQGTYMFKYAPFQLSSEKTYISTDAGNMGNAHSEYIGPLAETGILGSLSIIAVFIATIVTASKIYYRSNRRKVRLIALTLMLALITYYVHGCLNNFLDSDKMSALVWGFTAMIVALDVYYYMPQLEAEKRKKELNKTLLQA